MGRRVAKHRSQAPSVTIIRLTCPACKHQHEVPKCEILTCVCGQKIRPRAKTQADADSLISTLSSMFESWLKLEGTQR